MAVDVEVTRDDAIEVMTLRPKAFIDVEFGSVEPGLMTVTPIRITSEGRSWAATLEDLVCEDGEALEAEPLIRAAFARGESYRLGGGAAPEVVLASAVAATVTVRGGKTIVLTEAEWEMVLDALAVGLEGYPSADDEEDARRERVKAAFLDPAPLAALASDVDRDAAASAVADALSGERE